MEFIKLNDNQQIAYFGECKITVNTILKQLIIIPNDDELKEVKVKFQQNFVQISNIFLILVENKDIPFIVLVFPNEEKGKKVFEVIQKFKETPTTPPFDEEMILQRFLSPILNQIHGNEAFELQMKNFINSMQNLLQTKKTVIGDQKHFFDENNLVVEREENGINIFDSASMFVVKEEVNNTTPPEETQKSPQNVSYKNFNENETDSDFDISDFNDESGVEFSSGDSDFESLPNKKPRMQHPWENANSKKKYNYGKIVKKPNFEFVKRRYHGRLLQKLIIFCENDRSLCYEYSRCNKSGDYYYCFECKYSHQISVFARFFHDKTNGDYVLQLKHKEHACEPINYQPEDLTSNLVYSADFTIDSFIHKKRKIQRLIIFDSYDRNLCNIYHHTYNQGLEYYSCRECLKQSKYNYAKLLKNNENETYVELSKEPHVCYLQPYIPSIVKTVKKPNFLIEDFDASGGIKKKRLIIFDQNDKTLCYSLYFVKKDSIFLCSYCQNLQTRVTARLRHSDDGEDYIEMDEHVCKPKNYKTNSVKIVKSPNFILNDHFTNKLKTLIVCDPASMDKTYEYSYKSCFKKFYCKKCYRMKKLISAKVIEDENGQAYVELSPNEHICQNKTKEINSNNRTIESLKKLRVCQKNDGTIESIKKLRVHQRPPDEAKHFIRKFSYELIYYMYYGVARSILIIFTNDDKSLCHEYRWNGDCGIYICAGCINQRPSKTVSAKVVQEVDKEEHIEFGKGEHICQPDMYKPEKFKNTIPIYKPHYEIGEKVENGINKKYLIIFKDADKKLYYEFRWATTNKYYMCSVCSGLTPSRQVHAKVFQENTEQEYIEICATKHSCQAKEYDAEKLKGHKIILEPDYKILQRQSRGKLVDRLVIFEENDKSLCHEYSLFGKYFYCLECKNKHKITILAQLFKNETKGDYIELKRKEHICKPKKFDPDGYSTCLRILKSSDFAIHKHPNCEDTKTLVVNHPTNKDLCYPYRYSSRNKQYMCKNCDKLHKYIFANIRDTDDKISVELGPGDHICEPEPAGHEINSSNFEVQYGEDNQIKKLIIFDSNNKNVCYHFFLRYGNVVYRCRECFRLKKTVFAKLYEKENGELFIKMRNEIHVCKPIKRTIKK